MALLRFKLSKFMFIRRSEWSKLRESSNTISKMLFSIAAKQGLFSILFVSLILFIESKLTFIPSISTGAESQYSTFTMGVAAIGGVFIGLYYSGLTAAAGAVYSNVPNQVRDLLVRERAGSNYIQFVAFCVSFALMFSIVFLVWEVTSLLGLLIIAFMSIGAVFGFVTLGTQAFNFFNPISLSYAPFKRLNKLPRDVVEGSFFSQDPSFQNHSRKLAVIELETLGSISKICEQSESLQGEPFRVFCVNLTYYFLNYRNLKSKIPLDSKWYSEEYKYPDWYAEYNSLLNISISTGTGLNAKKSPDTNWLEKKIWDIISSAFLTHLKAKEFTKAIGILSSMDVMISKLASTYDLDLSYTWALEITKYINSHCMQKQNADMSQLEYLELISRSANLSTTILLGFSKSISNISEKKLKQAADDIRGSVKLYGEGGLPLSVHKSLSDFYDKLLLESRIEGGVVSTSWYIADRLRLELLNYLKTDLETYIDKCYSLLENLIVHTKTEQDLLAKAVVYSKQIELENKLTQFHLPNIESAIKTLEDKRVSAYDWPLIKFEEIRENFEKAKVEFHRDIAVHTSYLMKKSRPKSVPDFAGQFMAFTNENIIDALLLNRSEEAIYLLANHAISCYNKTLKLYPELDNFDHPNSEARVRAALTPMLDLIELLGLSIVVFEFRNDNENIGKVERLWEALVTISQNENLSQWMLRSANLTISSLYAEPRYEIKFQWRRRVEDLLSTGPYHMVERGGFGRMVKLPNHSSALINALMPRESLSLNDVSGSTVFILRCLRKSVPVDLVSEAYHERNLRDSMERFQRNSP